MAHIRSATFGEAFVSLVEDYYLRLRPGRQT